MIHRSYALYRVFLLAVLASLSAAACGDDNGTDPFCGDGIVQYSEGEMCDDGSGNGSTGRCSNECRFNPGYCTFDREAACAQDRCGDFIAYDSCGQMALASCGECSEAGTVCKNNFCISEAECSLTEAARAELCRDRCKMLDAVDACGRAISVDCGNSCREGLECGENTGICFDPDQCGLPENTEELCTASQCGGLAVLDSCGAEKIIDCSGTEGAGHADPLKDLAVENGLCTGGLSQPWDETGKYRASIHRVGNVALYMLFKSELAEGHTGNLGSVGLSADGSIGDCETDFCAFIEKRGDDGELEYWFDTVSGTAVLQKLSPLTIEVSDAQFRDALAEQDAECITPKVSFSYAYSGTCTSGAIGELDGKNFGSGGAGSGRGFQASRTYRVGSEQYTYDQVVFYQNAPAFFLYAELNDFLSPTQSGASSAGSGSEGASPKFGPGCSIPIDTIGGIDGEGHPYCESEACVIVLAEHEYHASEGMLTLTARDAKKGLLAGEVTDAKFYMADADDISPRDCLSPTVSFSFEIGAETCETEQGSTGSCFTGIDEEYDWTASCTKATPVSEPEGVLTGSARRVALLDDEGWNEIEYLSDELNSSGSAILINVNDYYGDALPFSGGRLAPFENFSFHPLSSQWEVVSGSAYCLSPVCLGYIGGTQLYAPVQGTISVTSVEGSFSGSVDSAVFFAAEEDDSGETVDCVFDPISFSFSVPIEGDASDGGIDMPDAGIDPNPEDDAGEPLTDSGSGELSDADTTDADVDADDSDADSDADMADADADTADADAADVDADDSDADSDADAADIDADAADADAADADADDSDADSDADAADADADADNSDADVDAGDSDADSDAGTADADADTADADAADVDADDSDADSDADAADADANVTDA